MFFYSAEIHQTLQPQSFSLGVLPKARFTWVKLKQTPALDRLLKNRLLKNRNKNILNVRTSTVFSTDICADFTRVNSAFVSIYK
jgi:hypothetical protein